MDADERDICDYLHSWRGQFVAAREIARRAAGKWRFRDDPNWAVPILVRLTERKVIECDASGHYRLMPEQKKKDRKKWISPEVRKILEQSGKDFAEGVDIDKETE
jgi:hypothetical protein